MTSYIAFETETGETVLVEVDGEEAAPSGGIEKAGLLDRRPAKSIASAAATFEQALGDAIDRNVAALDAAVKRLPEPPRQIEVTFGLKATGELGNIAIAKVAAEASMTIKLAWTRE